MSNKHRQQSPQPQPAAPAAQPAPAPPVAAATLTQPAARAAAQAPPPPAAAPASLTLTLPGELLADEINRCVQPALLRDIGRAAAKVADGRRDKGVARSPEGRPETAAETLALEALHAADKDPQWAAAVSRVAEAVGELIDREAALLAGRFSEKMAAALAKKYSRNLTE